MEWHRLCAALLCTLSVLGLLQRGTCVGAGPAAAPQDRFLFWKDYPGSKTWKSESHNWWDLIQVQNGSSFDTTNGVHVEVNWADHKAIHLYADPEFLQYYDQVIQHSNGALSSTMTGTIDECGWPAQTPSEAPASLQWSRQTTPFVDDFRNGLDPANWVVATGSKGCCDPNITINVDIGADTVNGHVKNVLKLTAWNEDTLCPGPKCHKYVSSAGMVQTAAHFASARYEVQAKVPAAEGVVWAVWMYHHEVHQPAQCDLYTCYCGDGGKDGCPQGKCMPPSQYEADACPMHGPGYTEPCGNTTICDAGWGTSVQGNCGMKHLKVGPDPQFVGSQTFDGYEVLVNHEIDIEIPANCEKTSNVCNPSCDYDYSTANFNNYIYTNNGGEGPAYTNMCIKATQNGKPMQLIGDGEYHTYRFDWHSGTPGNVTSAYVDFFIDDIYMGTNNAFVPTRGSRLSIALWGAGWNGYPNNWGGGHPGDGKIYSQTALVSEVKITPFNDPNDIMYMSIDDQPTGCEPPVIHQGSKCHTWTSFTVPPVVHPTTDDDDMNDDDAPPPPPDCTAPTDRTNGCPCRHSQQCASDWCTGVPATCEHKP